METEAEVVTVAVTMPAPRGTRWKAGFSLLEIMVVVAIIGVLLIIAVPNYLRARVTAQRNACIANLKALDGAKEQWAIDQGKSGSDTPIWTDLFGVKRGYIRLPPLCPANGTYTWGDVSTKPSCSHGITLGHTI